MQGIVQAVQTSPGGDYPIETSPAGSTQLAFGDAVDFDPMGGTVDINGLELNYVGVDLDQDLMTLAEPLPVEVTEVDFVATVPATETMEAVVGLADGTVTAEVPHELKPMLEEGERHPEDGEAVLVEEVSVGTFVITSVLGAQAHLDARYVSHADEMLLESKQRLGEVLAENDAAISQAQSDLSEARSRLDDAFSEIDLKPDQAYVDAAKQQAIDAAAVDASTKANAVSSALDAAQTALEAAIASGDSGAIADAEALIAAAKAEAIAAAEADATAKAGEAMAKANAALTAAQSAQATADNAIRTYYAETPPWPDGSSQPEESLGDMWYKDSTGQAYRWNGAEWKVIVDQTIGQALAAAQGAQATADGKITAFYQNSAPLEAEEGDLWFDLDDNSKIYYRRSGQWVVGSNPKALADAAQSAAVAQAQQSLDAAQVALQQAIASGDADAIAAAQAKADAAQAAAEAAVAAAENRALSRGTDLVTNGTGYLRNNYNFSSLTFDPTDAPTGSSGSFLGTPGVYTQPLIDEFIPVDTSKSYRVSAFARQTGPANSGTLYMTFRQWDAYGNEIRRGNTVFTPGTTTTLAAELKQGDTVMKLTSAAGWDNTSATASLRHAIFWDYVDPGGKAWPTETYSRNGTGSNTWPVGGIDFATNTITLTSPYSGETKPAGTPVSNGDNRSFYTYVGWNVKPTQSWTQRSATISGLATPDTGNSSDGGGGVQGVSHFQQGTATVKVGFLLNYQPDGPSNIAVAGVSLSDASAAKEAADKAQAAADEAKQDAADALTDAKAYTVERTDGISRSYDSTALPGTTEAPQDSVWYQRDGTGKIIAVFVQKGSGMAADWQARTITSEVIDNLDVGKLTAIEGSVNQLVANEFAAKLANIIEANVGNLTVTGDTHLDSLVAQTIAGDTAEFMSLTVDQILAGFLQAQWIITESGSIIAGDPAGARVEIRHDGVRVYVVGPNGDPYEAVVMVNGEISFGVIGQDGTRLGGIGSDGSVAGTSGSFSKEVSVKGLPVTGQLGGGARFGWLDNLPRGILAINRREKTLSASTEVERRYLYVTATLHPGRLYRVSARIRMQLNAQGALTYLRIRHSQGSGRVPIGAELLGTELGTATSPTTGNRRVSPMLEAFYSVETTQVHSFVSTFIGFYGAAPNAESGYIYVEDVGPLVPDTGGDDDSTVDTVLYQSTWKAEVSRVWNKTGSRITAKDDKISTWFWHGNPSDFQSSGWLYDGGVIESTDALEFGKTLPQALTGATVHKAEVYLRNKVWYNDVDLGDLALGSLASSSMPNSKIVDGTLWVDDIAQGEGAWVEVPASWFGGGTNRGITLGDHDGQALNGAGVLEAPTSGEFHGPNDSDPPLLRITYSR